MNINFKPFILTALASILAATSLSTAAMARGHDWDDDHDRGRYERPYYNHNRHNNWGHNKRIVFVQPPLIQRQVIVVRNTHYNNDPEPVTVRQPVYNEGRYCREYQSVAFISAARQQTYGTACRQPDGSWEIAG